MTREEGDETREREKRERERDKIRKHSCVAAGLILPPPSPLENVFSTRGRLYDREDDSGARNARTF